jgi:hypothetical protein
LELRDLARRFAAVWKLAVMVPSAVLAPFMDTRATTLVLATVVLVWAIAGFVLRRRQRWITPPVDLAVALTICLTARSTTSVDQMVNGVSWVVAVAAITCLSLQLYTTTAVGVSLAAGIAGAFVLGGWLAAADATAELLPQAFLFLAQSGLCRWLYRMVRRGARLADELEHRIATQRQAAAVEAAQRADKREYLSALHDTAASTLLMVGLGLAGRTPWIRRQAAADLHVIRGGGRFATANEVDLVAVLTGLCGDARFSGPSGPVLVPGHQAEAIRGAVTEALANVRRHAGDVAAEVTLSVDGGVVVTVKDKGAGFDPSSIPVPRRGIRDSILARMAVAGGHTDVRSARGHGTTVVLKLPVGADEPAAESRIGAPEMFRGLRRAILGVTLAMMFGYYLPTLVAHEATYRSLTTQVVAFVVMVAVVSVAATRVNRGFARTPVALPVTVLAMAALAMVTQDPATLIAQPNWAYPLGGMLGVVLLMDRGIGPLAGFLVAHNVITAAVVAFDNQAGWPGLVSLGIWASIVMGIEFAVGAVAVALRGVTERAGAVVHEQQQLRVHEAIQAQLHRDREARYANVAGTAGPVLAGLADGRLDPSDESVRRTCAIEAARMRRLFAENDESSAPLLHELRACADLAERNGVQVTMEVSGSGTTLPLAKRRLLTDPVLAILTVATQSARITVTDHDSSVTVSVVADAPGDAPMPGPSDGIQLDCVRRGNLVWLEVTLTRQ